MAVEAGWRGLHYQPNAVDSPALWKYWYRHIACGRPEAIAIVGSSRIQTGVSRSQLRRLLPRHRVAQLAKDGAASSIGVLRMLADDNDFRGIVICDMLAPYLRRSVWDHQREFYNYPAGPRQRVEAALRACVQDHLSFNNNRTGVLAALKCLVESGQLPRSEPVRMRADRSLAIDFAAIADLEVYKREDVSYYRRLYEGTTHPDIDDLRDELQEISDFVRRIQARGGQVIFLHMPSSGDRLQLEEEFHPKARYWDHFASMCSGIFIHATQLAGERGLSCPDNSHLDADGATRLTTLLVDEMLRQKVIESR